MILCYVTWGGSAAVYSESTFSILTYLSDTAVSEICVITEKPEFYAAFSEKINVVHCPPQEMESWAGAVMPCKLRSPRAAVRPYSFRHKIKAVEKVVSLYPGRDIFYIDSDTFRGMPHQPVRDGLKQGKGWLHSLNGKMSRSSFRVNKEVYALLKGRNLDGFTVDENTLWFNSGAVGLPGGRAKDIIASVLRINEEVYELTGFYSTEELAFSFGLAKYCEVLDSSGFVGHYWGNETPWVEMITLFLSSCHMQGLSLEEQVRLASAIDPKILPLYIHHPSRRKQIMRFLEKYFPLRRPRYFPVKSEEW